MVNLEETIFQLVKFSCEISYDCKGHFAYEDEEIYTPNLKYCELTDLFDPKQIRCKYMAPNTLQKYCTYGKQ